jgi:hypothetical protein
MLPQNVNLTLTFEVEQLGNFAQRHAQLPMEQDSLQAQEFLAPIVTIAVRAHGSRLQQSDRVVVMQGANGDSRYRSELLDRELFHACPRLQRNSGL